jgi:hypothetical protein
LATAGALSLAAPFSAGPTSQRIVAVGDIHGDYDAFLAILQRAGILDSKNRWTAQNTTLVQTGDMLDRGPKSRAVMDLLMRLEQEAPRNGGRTVVLLGNHEAMNIFGDLRYVTNEDYDSFADTKSEERRKAAYATYSSRLSAAALPEPRWMKSHPPGFIEQRDALSADGKYGRWLRNHSALVRIDDTVFLHGGISPKLANQAVETLNRVIASEIQEFDAIRELMVHEKLAFPYYTLDELTVAAQTAVNTRSNKKDDAVRKALEEFLRFPS